MSEEMAYIELYSSSLSYVFFIWQTEHLPSMDFVAFLSSYRFLKQNKT